MNIENLSAEDKHGQRTQNIKKEMQTMSTNTSNHLVNPAAREAMDKFKMEAAAEVGVNLTTASSPAVRQAPSAARWSRR